LLTPEGKLQEDKKEKINYQKSPFLNTEYLGINMDMVGNSSLQKKEVRQALNYAIDRSLMLEVLRNNVGQPANAGFIPIGLPSHASGKVKGYNYDLEKARHLLKEAGFPNGRGMEPITIFTNQDYIDITTYVAKEWEKIGVVTKIELMESAVLRAGMRKSSIPLFRASWIAEQILVDEAPVVFLFYDETAVFSTKNISGLSKNAVNILEVKQLVHH